MTAVQISISSEEYKLPQFGWYEFYGSQTNLPVDQVEAEAEYFDIAFSTHFLRAGLVPGDTWYHWVRAVSNNGTVKSGFLVLGPITIIALGADQIANGAITYSKIQNVSATSRLLGRASAGAGTIEEIVFTTAGMALLQGANAAAQRTSLGLAALATLGVGTGLTSGGGNLNADVTSVVGTTGAVPLSAIIPTGDWSSTCGLKIGSTACTVSTAAKYVVIGDFVIASARIDVVNKNGGTGSVVGTGMPFPLAGQIYQGGFCNLYGSLIGMPGPPQIIYTGGGSSQFEFYLPGATDDFTPLTHANLGSNVGLGVTLIYRK